MRKTDSLSCLLLSSQRAVSAPVCPAAGICSSGAFSVRLGLGHTTPERVESASLPAKTRLRTPTAYSDLHHLCALQSP